MTVIEVDLDASPDVLDRPPPAHRYRWAGLALVAALLLTLGGAAPVTSVLWRAAGSIPLVAGWFTLDGDRLYTFDEGTIQGWDLAPVERRWSVTPASAPEPPSDTVAINIGGRLSSNGDTILAQLPDASTVVIDADAGRIRRQSPGQIQLAAGGVGLTQEMVFRPGSEYDRSSGDPGALYLSPSTGKAYTEPPQSTELRAADLDTGRRLWSLPGKRSIFTAPAGDLLLVVSANRLALIEPRTGAIVRERAAADLSWSWVVGDAALVRHGDRMTAYDLRTLEPRWEAAADRAGPEVVGGACDELICRTGPAGMEVLDPATGAVRWQTGRDVSLSRHGDVVIETDSVTRRPLRLLDLATGRVLGSLRAWHSVAPQGPGFSARAGGTSAGSSAARGAPAVLIRPDSTTSRRVVGALRDGLVQPLGYAGPDAQDCQAGGRFVACRTAAGVDVFETGISFSA